MGDPNNLSRADYINFIKNAAQAIANGKVTGFLPDQAAAIAAAGFDGADRLHSANKNQVELRAAALASTEKAKAEHRRMKKWYSSTKAALRAANANPSEYEALGFDPPDENRSFIVPAQPTRLVGVAHDSGTNKLKYKGNNRPGSVTYEIESRLKGSGDYQLVGTSKSQTFLHRGVIRGETYEYRVKAKAARGPASPPSNFVVIFAI